MRRGSLNPFTAGLLVAFALFLAGCNYGYTTWNGKSISVTGSSSGLEISTSPEAARVVLGEQVIVFRNDSVTFNGVYREVQAYKKVAVSEAAGTVKITLDGVRVF